MANAGVLYDKYTFIQKLQKRGFSHEQAEGIAEILSEGDASQVANKADLTALEARLYKFTFTAMAAQTALIVGLIQPLK
jgi:hypothetical protein